MADAPDNNISAEKENGGNTEEETIEVKFEDGDIELQNGRKITFQWAMQQINETRRLIFHFFLGEKRKNPDFFAAMAVAGMEIPGVTFEVFYTEEFDGHDLIINNINPFTKTAIKNTIVKYLKLSVDKGR